MYIIYLINNMINNKKYIGLTSKTLEERWGQHCNEALNKQSNYTFHKAIRKYGKDNFEKIILEENLTKEEAKERERYWIKYYNSYSGNKLGYNDTYGGDLNDHLCGENSPVAKINNKQFYEIVDLLKNTDLSYTEIVLKLNLDIGEKEISEINCGKNWHQKDFIYPIRNGKSISKTGTKNHFAKLTEEKVLQIIEDLKNTKIMQKELAKKYNICYNTINLINRCKIWKHLHNYKENIRNGK